MSEQWPSHIPPRWRLSKEQIYEFLLAQAEQAEGPASETQPDCSATTSVASYYVPMRDETRIAIDVWLPADHDQQERLPAVVMFTRYWRAQSLGGERQQQGANSDAARIWNAAGYAYVVCDVRGSGASFGCRTSEYSEEEIADYSEVIEWVAVQPWCDGFVATEGGSYSGNAAELAAVHHPSALRAAIPRYTDFDSYQSIACPGGVPNLAVLQIWSAVTHALDRALTEQLFGTAENGREPGGPMWIDGDRERFLLKQAIDGHSQNFNVYDVALRTEFADDSVGGVGSRETTSLYRRGSEITGANVPQFAWASWMDAATADGLISRFLTFEDLRIRAVIGAWGHLGLNSGDPYGKQKAIPAQELILSYAEFLDEVRTGEDGCIARQIRYYTIGADRWQTTPIWPPEGIADEDWYLTANNMLSTSDDKQRSGVDHYTVGNTTTGTSNRWHTQLGGDPVDYGDREFVDKDLLCYSSEPLQQALEITGHPIVDLFCAFSTEDAVLHVYLEDVALDGAVTLVTEGLLRVAHRTELEMSPPYRVPGPTRRFYKEDLCPLVPRQVTRLRFRLLPTSCQIEAGHRIRIALAGRDVDTFAVYPDDGPQEWHVRWGAPFDSKLVLPTRQADTSPNNQKE